jgi:hypothetical protein
MSQAKAGAALQLAIFPLGATQVAPSASTPHPELALQA